MHQDIFPNLRIFQSAELVCEFAEAFPGDVKFLEVLLWVLDDFGRSGRGGGLLFLACVEEILAARPLTFEVIHASLII
jgi:hypothetical protein